MTSARTLLIDNYDSFTHNLYHLITRVNGMPPVVIRNDETAWQEAHLRYFDNVVISPGPGRPQRQADFGICSNIIRTADIPILGICLGHQGICAQYGARIDLAPEPRHGRLSAITHGSSRLFEDIPSPFSAVRYHSLAAYDLPEEMEAIAWSEDGLIMAARHRTKPQFGVQFHPESICTEHGETLFANFLAITRKWRQENRIPPSLPLLDNVLSAYPYMLKKQGEKEQTNHYTVLHRQLACTMPAETLFDLFFRKNPYAIWLDSSRQEYGSGRFSMMCDASGPLGRTAKADVQKQLVSVTVQGKTRHIHDDFFDWLEKDLDQHHIDLPDTPFEFALGWIGYIGYEMKALSETVTGPPSSTPDACLVFCDRALVIDHEKNDIWLLALSSSSCQDAARTWLEKTAEKLREPKDQWPVLAPLPDRLALESPLKLRHGKTAYLNLITACKEALIQGESYEICLTNMAYADISADPWTIWRMLRQTNPAPYGAYLQLDDIAVLSCSPERFLRISRDRIIESKPIKGTRPRSADAALDRQLKEELSESEKERAENLMIVDLVRNDLGRIAQPGSVSVPRLFDIESYQTVHQMVSTVRARIQDGISASQCVRAAFPGGSMTGAPKRRTLQIIDCLENGPRGIYSGVLGYFSLCGAVDLSIIIRTLVVAGTHLSFGVGGAITALSDAKEEFEETRVKAQAFLSLFDTDFPFSD
ncbi:aminodeoxychorismate synthase [Oxalobacter sp. OttesenSCG-928-P03]|nr:aminodeoxychorismate synthase [Oxalobacter sp. OttesenSCG-928-P03]